MPSAITTIWNLKGSPYENELKRVAAVQSATIRRMQSQSVVVARDTEDQLVKIAMDGIKKREALEAESYARRSRRSAVERQQEAAANRVESARLALNAATYPGIPQTKLDLKAQRDALAQALREQRAMRPGMSGMRHLGGFGGGASAMLVSVARDTAASLASGANPVTVFMQQAPQVLQAMTMMNEGFGAFLKRMLAIRLIGPLTIGLLGAIAGGVVVLGLAFAGVVRAMRDYADQARNADDITRLSAHRFSEEADALDKAAKSAREYHDWLEKLNKQRTISGQSDTIIDRLKEEADSRANLAKLEQDAARLRIEMDEKQGKISRGEAIRRTAQLEIDGIKKAHEAKLAALKSEAEQLAKDYSRAATAAEKANADAMSPGGVERITNATAAKRKYDEAVAVAQAAEDAIKKSQANIFSDPLNANSGQSLEVNGKKYYGSLAYWKQMVDYARQQKEAADAALSPQERRAAESQSSAAVLRDKSNAASSAYANALIYGTPEMQAQIRNRQLQLQNDLLGANKLLQMGAVNSLQKQGGGYVFPAQNQMLSHVKSIDHNVARITQFQKTGAATVPVHPTRY